MSNKTNKKIKILNTTITTLKLNKKKVNLLFEYIILSNRIQANEILYREKEMLVN